MARPPDVWAISSVEASCGSEDNMVAVAQLGESAWLWSRRSRVRIPSATPSRRLPFHTVGETRSAGRVEE